MAVRRTGTHRNQLHTDKRYSQFYVYGNTVQQPEVLPKQKPNTNKVHQKRASSQVKKNRKRAMDMNPVYMGFLTIAAICAVIVCVIYLQLQTNIVQRSENITALQQELSDLTEQNDTAYNAAVDSVNLQDIKEKAMNELGMVYAADGNVVEYDSPTSDYVKQYDEIPSDGVVAK